MDIWHPTVQDVLTAHEVVKANSEVRTEGLKSSQEKGIKKIQETLQKARNQENVYLSAAVYLKKLIDEHPFNDGNKRTAIMIADRFMEENGESFQPHKVQNTEELYETIKWELPSMSIDETAHWIETGEIKDANT
ncbi:type II toxin-antitoxin system death-on-curing family toxin [Candidatus Nanohalobium constans]|uniref:Death-on-curing family protein n=1 Tax=Candidatus Nanohalobium constans TaxID=2565781 RepID=A0A5Q0UFQ2_9ARCH|nr:type II toxin-antitoxin system death-on-curing family toxin [Candidatus Nanohalobium constans]QGA80452.1 death-on-curing family protein [Candidatus Nanohalobium constans]